MSIRRRFAAALLASALAVPAIDAPALAGEYDDRLAEIAAEYEGAAREEVPAPEPEALSDDELISRGDWTGLARKYDVLYAETEGKDAPKASTLAAWWNTLGDDTLTDLIRMALSRNRSLEEARARVVEAREALGISRAAFLPWLDATGLWTNADTSENGLNGGTSYNLYRLGIDASWEIDIFGGRRAETEAAAATLAQAHAGLHAAWVSLAAETARNYIDLCALRERLGIANSNLELQLETLDLLQSQYEAGLADELALNQARYTVEQTRASIPPIKASIEAAMNTLAILAGEAPGSLNEILSEPRPIPRPDTRELIGIPAEAMRRRPDIRAAEMEFVAQTARTRSARADLYPKFRLLGSIGLESLSTGSLFKDGSYGFSIGPQISWPIFHGGAIRRNIKVQEAREERLLAAYEQAVLNAAAEVRSALVNFDQQGARLATLTAGADAARSALEVAQDKYRNGLSDFNNVIIAQAALLSFEDQRVSCEGAMTASVVQLFKALGGGWAPLAEEELSEAEQAAGEKAIEANERRAK